MAQIRVAISVAWSLCAWSLCAWGLCLGTAQAADSRLQIVSFTAPDCKPCASMVPVLEALARDGWQIHHVDVQEHPELVKPFKVTSLPTIVVMQERREVDRVVGTLGYTKLAARFEQALRVTTSPAAAGSGQGVTPPKPARADDWQTLAGPPSSNAPRDSRAQWLQQSEPMAVRGQSPSPDDYTLAMNDTRSQPRDMIEFNPPAPRGQPASLASARSADPGRPASPTRSGISTDERAQRATVRIKIEDAQSIAFGTGTVINVHGDQALVLTCGHIFRGVGRDAQLSVEIFDRGRVIAVPSQAVSASTDKGDIGLIEFRSPIAIEPVPIADLRNVPEVGAPAFSFGCDHGADPTRRDTKITHINRYLGPANIEIAGAPVLGRSGGGLFNAGGQLIGVCNAANNEDDEGLYASLPVIHEHLAALRLDSLPQDPVSAPVSATLANAAPATMTGSLPAAAPTGPKDYWPDQKFAQDTPPASAAQATAQATAQEAAAPQLQCVIRDARGQETVLTIERPSQELIAWLKSQSR